MECCLYKFPYNDWDCTRSRHLNFRYKREHMAIAKMVLERPRLVRVFVVNKDHIHGIELHALFSNGIIKIINPTSRKIISYLFPRVEQLEHYYGACGLYVPFWLQKVAEENCQKS